MIVTDTLLLARVVDTERNHNAPKDVSLNAVISGIYLLFPTCNQYLYIMDPDVTPGIILISLIITALILLLGSGAFNSKKKP